MWRGMKEMKSVEKKGMIDRSKKERSQGEKKDADEEEEADEGWHIRRLV